MTGFAHTPKQIEIAGVVLKAADAGKILSLRELRQQLSYGFDVSKQAILCSLKILRDYGLIEYGYGASLGSYKNGTKLFVKPTPSCYTTFRR